MPEVKNRKQFNSEYRYEIAKKRNRVLAFIVDFHIFGLFVFVIGIFFGTPLENEIGFSFNGFSAMSMMTLGIILWPFSELIWSQTIGKRIFNLKVIADNHKPINFSQAMGRFFLGSIDCMFLIGLITATVNQENKRIGDLVSNTIVVQEI